MGKLIAKTAAITLGAIVVLALILLGMFSWFAPGIMVSITDSLGLDGACATYSISVYNRSGEIEDLAVAVERCYNIGDYQNTAELGARLLADEDFAQYCEQRDAAESSPLVVSSYRQYAAGIVAESQYRTGNGTFALNTAFDALGDTFSYNNAVVMVGMVAIDSQDAAFCGEMLNRLDALPLDEDIDQDLKSFKDMLRDVVG